jgi:hypothetical protein
MQSIPYMSNLGRGSHQEAVEWEAVSFWGAQVPIGHSMGELQVRCHLSKCKIDSCDR